MPKTKTWHREEIKAAVRMAGWTLTDLSENAGLHRSTCSKALTVPCKAGEEAIAAVLGKRLEDLWPDRHPDQAKQVFVEVTRQKARVV